ncbi:MAG: hypothetical protein WDO16_23880 [Bacteroidota bacterium]
MTVIFMPAPVYGFTSPAGCSALNEALETEELLKEFTMQWKSHGTPVKRGGSFVFRAIHCF